MSLLTRPLTIYAQTKKKLDPLKQIPPQIFDTELEPNIKMPTTKKKSNRYSPKTPRRPKNSKAN